VSPSRLVVVGASAGGVAALLELSASLPHNLPAPVLVVLHIGANPSVLPSLLSAHGHNRAVHAQEGQRLEDGVLYVAPPDHHMLVEDGRIRLSHGPKEHNTRPAIDPLFRSAALAHGRGVIGVLLTGELDDGTAGLKAIKDCGGLAIVQDPADAEHPSMPASALRTVAVDRCVPLSELGATLVRMLDEPVPAEQPAAAERDRLEREMTVFRGAGRPMEKLNDIGAPSTFACPDCNSVLWQLHGAGPPRYRCHTGHAFTLRTLEETQAVAAEEALWRAIRALEQREGLLRKLAEYGRSTGAEADALRSEEQAEETAQQVSRLRRMVVKKG
jgi:two-component system chemotaxis response regulator CheB